MKNVRKYCDIKFVTTVKGKKIISFEFCYKVTKWFSKNTFYYEVDWPLQESKNEKALRLQKD